MEISSAVVTVEEAGRFLRLSRSAAYRAAARGEIPTIRLGRRLLVPTAKLLAMVGLDPADGLLSDHAAADRDRISTGSRAGESTRPEPSGTVVVTSRGNRP